MQDRGVVTNERGIALITIMLVMVIMTVIGIAALTVTGMENRMAGFQRTGEAAATAAESCVGTGSISFNRQSTWELCRVPTGYRMVDRCPI